MYEQYQKVKVLEDLVSENFGIDPHMEYILKREKEIFDMIQEDLTLGNPGEWVATMVSRARFGKNQSRQEEFVGGKITRKNMKKILKYMYDGIPPSYKGGIRHMFNHESLDIDLISEMRYTNKYFADVPPRNVTEESVDSIPITNPFDIIDEFQKVKEEFKFQGPRALESSNNINAMSTDYCAMQLVNDNKEGFTKRQVERANKA